MNCGRPGCTGTIEDGYCNVCGMAPTASASATAPVSTPTTPPGPPHSTPSRPSGAPSTPSRPSGGRKPGTRSTRTRGSGSVHSRGSLGAGLVDVAPVPYQDPASVINPHPEVPESRRFCGRCGNPVGRARGERPGRTEGFCPTCGQRFSFRPKLQPGELVAGQYQIAGCLAHGGLGWIYLAQDRHVSDRWVVLKGLLDSGDESAMAAAIAERQFLAQVEHPNIVRIYNFVTHDEAGYIVMEYVGGQSIKDLRKRGPIPVAQACAYLIEILPALGYLHSRGLLYCDFKPDNVIQTEEQLKLIDLGGVRSIDDDQSDLYGTVGYQAPEVAEAGASIASDLYTVARSLAVMTFDFRGFSDPDRFATALPPAADIPLFARYEALHRFLVKGTHPDPEARFQSADEMREQLLGVLRQVLAVEGGRPTPVPSRLFTPELAPDPDRPAWRPLPAPTVDPADPAAALLASLAATPSDQMLWALSTAPQTPEVTFRAARALVEVGRVDDAERTLTAARAADPTDWRCDWWTGVARMAAGDARAAAQAWGAVATELPGELAPVLAIAVAAEVQAFGNEGAPHTPGAPFPEMHTANQGAANAAAARYQLVAAADSTSASACFGLARVRWAQGDRAGSAAALALVPATSSASTAAQIARCRVLSAPLFGRQPSPPDLLAASAALDALNADPATKAALTKEILTAALPMVRQGAFPAPAGTTVAGADLDERSIRKALEGTCRALARSAHDREERIALIDEANAARVRTLL